MLAWLAATTLQAIDVKKLRGVVVAVLVMNVGAFEAGTRGDPLDTFSYDMNRVYPGKATGYPTERAAGPSPIIRSSWKSSIAG